MAMVKIFWRVWNVIVRTEETESVLIWLFPPLSGVTAMISAWTSNLPLYQIMFWGFGVAFFALGLIANILIMQKKNSVKNKIAIRDCTLPEGPFIRDNDLALRFAFRIKSYAEREIYFKVKRIHFTIEGRAPINSELPDIVHILQAQSEEHMGGPLIEKIEKKPVLFGALDMEIIYGPSRNNLCFQWTYQGDIGLHIKPAKTGGGSVYTELAHNIIEHKRVAA